MFKFLHSLWAPEVLTSPTSAPTALLTATPLTTFTPDGPPVIPPSPKFVKDTVNGWIMGHHPACSASYRDRFQSMLLQLQGAFAYSLSDLVGYCGHMGPMRIQLKPDANTSKLFSAKRKYSPHEQDVTNKSCNELRDVGFTVKAPADTGVVSCPTLPSKKDLDGRPSDTRFCIDIRAVNDATVPDKYGLHLPEELFQRVGKSKFFSKIDLRGAFLQLPIHPDDQYLTSHWWGNEIWMYTRAPYGLRNSPAFIQRLMDSELAKAGLSDFCICFIDDLLVHSDTEEEHIKHVAAVLAMLLKIGLRAHPDKCIFCCEAVEYLGFLLGTGFLNPHSSKIEAIQALKTPNNVKQLQAVLGLCNYYRCFLPDFSVIAHDLHALTRLGVKWHWDDCHQTAFDTLKSLLCEEGRVLRHYDRDATTLLYTDWCNHGMGAVLAQVDESTGLEHIVACISKTLNKHEVNYGSYHGELSAAVWAIRSFRHYLHGINFTLVTDHMPLKWLLSTTDLVGKPARWVLMIQEFSFVVEHRAGKDHINADILSRFPTPSTFNNTGTRLDTHPDDHQSAVEHMQQHLAATHLADPPSRHSRSAGPPPTHSNIAPPRPRAAAAASPSANLIMSIVDHPYRNPACFLSQSITALHIPPAPQEIVMAAPTVSKFMDIFAPIRKVAPSDSYLPDGWWDPNSLMTNKNKSDSTNPASPWLTRATKAACKAAQDIQRVHLPPALRLQLGGPLTDDPTPCRHRCGTHFPGAPPAHCEAICSQPSDLRATLAIDNSPVGPEFYAASAAHGLVLIELFGGICAGLEMLLAAGFTINQYVYVDSSEPARKAAWFRLVALSLQYPAQLPRRAWEDTAMIYLPMDVRDIEPRDILTLVHEMLGGEHPNSRFMMVAGWPCEDLSSAGRCLGLDGPRSSAFFDAIRVLGCLQQLLSNPPAYLFENTYMLWGHTPKHIKERDLPRINSILGPWFATDAARFDSGAYRLRMFWSNLQAAAHMDLVLQQWQRTPDLLVLPLLGEGRILLNTTRNRRQQPPNYQCNLDLSAVEVLPTLVSFPHSNNYKTDKAGMLWDNNRRAPAEPNSDERERLLGYETGTTAAPGLTEKDRFKLTGQCMDANQLRAIIFTALALDDVLPSLSHRNSATYASQALFAAQPAPPQQPPVLDGSWPTYPMTPTAWGEHTPPKRTEPLGARLLRKQGWLPGQPLGCRPATAGSIAWPLEISGKIQGQSTEFHGLGFHATRAVTDSSSDSDSDSASYHSATSSDNADTFSKAVEPPDSPVTGGGIPLPTYPAVSPVVLFSSTLRSVTAPCHHDQLSCCHHIAAIEELEQADPSKFAHPAGHPYVASTSNPDIWLDGSCCHYLKEGRHAKGTSAKEKQRVWKRLKNYQYLTTGHIIQRRMRDQTWKTIPPPDQRTKLILRHHRQTGHWGVRRTHYMTSLQYWWNNMRADIEKVLDTCEECSRIKASFSAAPAELQPLAIEGLFYRWSVDLCGPFPISKRGHRYVMVMIDGFSKQIEVAAIPDKTTATTAYTFTREVLCRYGACAEVVTDQGAEWQDDFHQCLVTAFIDHRTTSANHPSANGQAERTVQSIKRALEKHAALEDGSAATWDEYLPHVALGYRVSVQESLGFSPYELLYGTKAILPSAIREHFTKNFDLKNTEQAAEYLKLRADLLLRHCAVAANNLRIAQQRDTLRYLRMRSGYYNTIPVKFQAGDLIYLRRPNPAVNLQGSVRAGIYRIREVRDGVLVIHGKCGTLAEVHSTNCAPCHLANINPAIDSSLRDIPDSHVCRICRLQDRGDVMLICDGCQRGYHLDCLDPPLTSIPEEATWCCDECVQQGITPVILEELLRQDQLSQGIDKPVLRNQQQEREDKAAAMDGQPILIRVLEPNRTPVSLTGKLTFLPPDQRTDARRPLRLHAPGFRPVDIAVSKATRATRSRMDISLQSAVDPSLAQYCTQVFTAARGAAPAAYDGPMFTDTYDLLSVEGYTALYQDAFGTTQGLPTAGTPLEWVPELDWMTDSTSTIVADEPLTAAAIELLFSVVDLQSCFRIADPVAKSVVLLENIQQRYQRTLLSTPSSPAEYINWLTPLHYRRLATKGPIDWIFLYPPLSIADLSLTLAASRARVGVAMYIPCTYLSALNSIRLQVLTAFKAERRLATIHSWDSDFLWVCVFTTTSQRARMLCPSSAVITAWTSF
jgi:transposase InsO family protein